MPTTQLGITFPNASYYLEGWDTSIGRVTDGVTYLIASLRVKCYTDSTKEYTLEDGVVLGSMRQDFTEVDNTSTKHYEWLMTLDQFSNATLINE